jgi:transcription-repair coupling factor (superfamily II helicase)
VKKIVSKKEYLVDSVFRDFFKLIDQREKIHISGLKGSAKSLFVSILFRKIENTLLIVCPTEKEARNIHQDVSFFAGDERAFLYLPWESLSTDMFAFQQEVEMLRMEGLCRLWNGEPMIIIAPVKALMQKVIPKQVFEDYIEMFSVGDTVDRDAVVSKLTEGGYLRASLVEGKGEFSVRGHIIDIFPSASRSPYRMEFVGDEIESIRQFDVSSQRSSMAVSEFVLTPAREVILSPARRARAIANIRVQANEMELPRQTRERLTDTLMNGLVSSVNPLFLSLFYERFSEASASKEPLGTIFDYIPSKTILVFNDKPAIWSAYKSISNQIDQFLHKAYGERKIYPERRRSYLDEKELQGYCEAFRQIDIEALAMGLDEVSQEENSSAVGVKFAVETDMGFKETLKSHAEQEGILSPIVEKIKRWTSEGNLVIFLCGGHEEMLRMAHLMEQYRLSVKLNGASSFLDDIDGHDGMGRLILKEGRITEGFYFPLLGLVAISEEQLFGRKVIRKSIRPSRVGYFLKSFGELKEGDPVVHTEHGIGLYRGLKKLGIAGMEGDFLVVEYLEGDRLYIPVDRLNMIQRYIGPEGYVPRIDKLGGSSWETVKERVKRSICEVAEELVSIYASREVMDRPAYSAPDRIYEEFCSGFEYEETPDQTRAIEDIHLDMNSAKPMDRLICGDAGFGKTEVALRASFRAAMDGKQVAILAPTTILAEQHYRTFTQRLNDYPLRVETLNRLKTKAEQHRIVSGIKNGFVDIVIGTHRILQKDVIFKELGLVIIDEEQRFGVSHKEKLKKLRALVDVLTLTATPIPRTLHLSLIGIRDLSIINTPPEDRLPVKTYVVEFSEDVIREAIQKELDRNGQIFFVHDRIKSIYSVARFIERLFPNISVGVVHGRMHAKEIEDAKAKFVRKNYNILICTTIVGAGLDIPTANTIIINRADRFGLAQLYQLRGRVGRSKEEAHAYLLVPKGLMLSRDAQRRLQVIMDFSEPGSGFRIASNDLEIRGAGNLLGVSQSGHISAVGYELYTELMEKAINEIRETKVPDREVKPEIHLGIKAFIPEDYMEDVTERLIMYKRLSMASSDDELSEMKKELLDCYGALPHEVENLIEVISIRNLLKEIKGEKMSYDGKNLSISFSPQSPVEPMKMLELSRRQFTGLKLTPDFRLDVPMPVLGEDEEIVHIKGLLDALVH